MRVAFRPTRRMTAWCIVVVVILFSTPHGVRAGAGTVDADDGEMHLNLHFRFLPQQEEIDRVQAQVRRASRILCDATDGQMRIASMRLSAGGAAEPAGDIWYQPPNATPRSSASGRLPQASGRIYLGYEAIRADVLAHELGHLVFDLGDQYDEQRRMGKSCGIGRSFELDAMDEVNHTIMQQADRQVCATPAGDRTGSTCYENADCQWLGPGATCPLPALMSELSTALNYDLLRGDEVLPHNTCPAPRAGDTVSVGGWLGEDLPEGVLDDTSFATADATAPQRLATDWIEASGNVPGYDEGSAHALYVYAEHVGPNAWDFHFAMDAKHFTDGTAGEPVWLEDCALDFEAIPTLDVVDPDGSLHHHRRVTAVNGVAGTSSPSCAIPIVDLANGAPDATLGVVFDEFSERVGSSGGTLRRTAFSAGTRILAGGASQLGRCTETEDCEKLWNTATDRWEAAGPTRSALRGDRAIESDWTHLVAAAERLYGLTLEGPLGLPDPNEPIPCADPTEFETRVEGSDQVVLLIDVSTSMNDDREYVNDTRTRLDWAKAGARGFAELQLGSGVEVALVEFRGAPWVHLGLGPIEADGTTIAGAHEISTFRGTVDDLFAIGATAIGDALAEARDMLAAEPDGRTQAVFLLSDGENTAGDADPNAVAAELRAAGVQVYTLPVGNAADGELLARIADETGGESYDAPTALELPTIYADLHARLRGETPIITRTALALEPGGPTTPGPSVDVTIPVEPGATRLAIMLSNRNDLGETWAPGFRLRNPGGAQVLAHTSSSVVNDPFFRLARVNAPQAGSWTLELFATNAVPQYLYYWAHVENPLPDCWAGAWPSLVTQSGPIEIHGTSSFRDALGRGISYTARISGPGGLALNLPLSTDESLSGASALLSGLTRHGRYDVVVRCEAGSEARFAPGEDSDTESALAQGRPPAFAREARTSFFLDTPGYPPLPPGGDCDHDGIPDTLEGATSDIDGDGLSNACDSDADGDDLPDSQEPVGDLDGDGIANFLDPDADADGIFDAIDSCVCVPEPGPLAAGLAALATLTALARDSRARSKNAAS